MSILIKGLSMPKENDELRLIIRSNGQVIISHQTYYEEAEAVSIPPHGRLIDADALTTVTEMVNGEFKTYIEEFEINDAPTIIEASPYRYKMIGKTDKPHGIYFIESEKEDD